MTATTSLATAPPDVPSPAPVTTPAAGIGIVLPSTWRRRAAPDTGVVVAARAPVLPRSGVRPEMVLRVASVTGGDLLGWRAAALVDLDAVLDALDVEDEDRFDTDGHQVCYHRFAHRTGVADVLCEQWSWLVDELGVTLTASVAREDYADHADLFEHVAASVRVPDRRGAQP